MKRQMCADDIMCTCCELHFQARRKLKATWSTPKRFVETCWNLHARPLSQSQNPLRCQIRTGLFCVSEMGDCPLYLQACSGADHEGYRLEKRSSESADSTFGEGAAGSLEATADMAAQPQTLQQEFTLINVNIPNVTVEQVRRECSAGRRECSAGRRECHSEWQKKSSILTSKALTVLFRRFQSRTATAGGLSVLLLGPGVCSIFLLPVL